MTNYYNNDGCCERTAVQTLNREDFTYKITEYECIIFYKDHAIYGFGKRDHQQKPYKASDRALLRQEAELVIQECIKGNKDLMGNNLEKYLKDDKETPRITINKI